MDNIQHIICHEMISISTLTNVANSIGPPSQQVIQVSVAASKNRSIEREVANLVL